MVIGSDYIISCGVSILLCPCGTWLAQYCAILFLIAYCCIKFDVPEYFLEYCVPMIMGLRNMVYHVVFAAFMIMGCVYWN